MVKRDKIFVKILVLIALVIVAVWFRKGEFIAGGEEGIWLYNPPRSLQLFGSGWVEFGLGVTLPVLMPKVPLLLVSSMLWQIITPWVIQAIIYFFLIFGGLAGCYFLCRELLSKVPKSIAFIISVFYMFNIYTLTQVWHRNIQAGIFSWSYLPLLFLLAILWVKSGKIKYIAASIVFAFAYASAFVTISFVATVWLPIVFYFGALIIEKRRSVEFRSLLLRISVFLLAWLGSNSWWVYPFITLGKESLSTGINYLDFSFNSLIGVSQYFPTTQIVLLRQAFYFTTLDPTRETFWIDFYNSPIAIALSVLIFIVVILGMIFLIRSKLKFRYYILALLLVGWFLVKGTNPPLGYTFYELLFKNIPVTMAFRNPWEKLGLVFLLPYSMLFGLGVYSFSKKLNKRRSLLVPLVIVLVSGLLVWPFWTGNVFPESAKLTVPDYYQKVSLLFNNDYGSGKRILLVPLKLGDSSVHTWEYRGATPSSYLFNIPVIDGPQSGAAETYTKLLQSLENKDTESLIDLLDDLAVLYVVVDGSVVLEEGRVQIVEGIKDYFASDPNFEFVKQIGDLEIYKFISQNNSLVAALGESVELNVKKVSPTRYKINVGDAKEPYKLVFKSSYSKNWVASIEGEVLAEHYMDLDYANGWKVDKIGTYEVDMVFETWPWQ